MKIKELEAVQTILSAALIQLDAINDVYNYPWIRVRVVDLQGRPVDVTVDMDGNVTINPQKP